ncbi:hypothetical protein M438DRAFT_381819 [Aureobasidium pullulans EXF-150]|uniref:BZIP domain-containing protein n=1 Tax=Aureobasidium pullulans EXF-150 TaxID=1043002 RepID=A0A074XD12_AURPU|nr:uncharacterized protein M438DRAFT_381819 [Aureobasidium pullulans EXF-150]KEQ83283.1 hypothetical protein M438DRAFT_381819 [Aureobasidium pullulans EXF-150]
MVTQYLSSPPNVPSSLSPTYIHQGSSLALISISKLPNTALNLFQMSNTRNYTSPRWNNLSTFRTIVPISSQLHARNQNREIPFLESRLEILNRHLLDTNHELRTKIDELEAWKKKCGELKRENEGLGRENRGLRGRVGRLVLENELLRGLERGRK